MLSRDVERRTREAVRWRELSKEEEDEQDLGFGCAA